MCMRQSASCKEGSMNNVEGTCEHQPAIYLPIISLSSHVLRDGGRCGRDRITTNESSPNAPSPW